MAATYWQPDGRWLTLEERRLLAVPALAKPTRDEHWTLWRERMEAQVLADQPGAAVMLSLARQVDKTLDLWLIVQNDPLPLAWRGLVGAETTQFLRRMIEWDQPGSQVDPPVQTLPEIALLLRQ